MNFPVVVNKDACETLSDDERAALNHDLTTYGGLVDKWGSVLAEKTVEKVIISDEDLAQFREVDGMAIQSGCIESMAAQQTAKLSIMIFTFIGGVPIYVRGVVQHPRGQDGRILPDHPAVRAQLICRGRGAPGPVSAGCVPGRTAVLHRRCGDCRANGRLAVYRALAVSAGLTRQAGKRRRPKDRAAPSFHGPEGKEAARLFPASVSFPFKYNLNF
ncbi:hypothetical protein KO516_17985 [Citreicella sp. C3M06]|nr:hypothetical protein [Citreicella sp. C3M06]